MLVMHTLTGNPRGAKRHDTTDDTAATGTGHRVTAMARSRQRVLGGVAAGIARQFNVDPLVPRIGFVLLALFAGAGAILYLLAWVALPSDDGPAPLDSVFGDRPRRNVAAVIGLVLVAVGGGLLVAALPGLAGSTLSVAVYLIGLGLGALWWRSGATRPSRDDGSDRSADQPTAVPDDAPTAVQAVAAPATTPPPVTTAPPSPPPPSTPAVATSRDGRGGRTAVWTVAAAVLLVLAAVAALVAVGVDISIQSALAVTVIAAGGGLIVAAFWGRVPGLAALGVVLGLGLVALAAVGVPFKGGVGEARWVPADTEELREEYHFGAGDAVLDLRELDLSSGYREVTATVGAGNLSVHVPDDVAVDVQGRAAAGDVEVFGRRADGLDATVHGIREPFDAEAELALDLEVGFGALRVQ